jgi:hypothetical protein
MNGPSSPNVRAMESTPVSGVEMRNAIVASRLAPFLRRDSAAGRTPQEHSGRCAQESGGEDRLEVAAAQGRHDPSGVEELVQETCDEQTQQDEGSRLDEGAERLDQHSSQDAHGVTWGPDRRWPSEGSSHLCAGPEGAPNTCS